MPTAKEPAAGPSYDFIIVGGGTSGCVLANRLTEDPNISVVVLEAGQDHSQDERVYTPGLSPQLQGDPVLDWQYVTQPQPGINGRQIKHPRGKLVGGTSAINSFALIYPSKAGLDFWAELGNEGWDWEGMKRYFKKFQTINPPNDSIRELNVAHSADNINQTSGPLEASFPSVPKPLHKAWVDAFRELGLESRSDPIDGAAIGGHTSTCHVSGGRRERSHAGVAFLEPARRRLNLHVITGAHVERLEFEGVNGKASVATGVSYIDDKGEKHFISATKEVILAAGTFASPQLLELSGIGDPSILNKHQIPLIYANKYVGENLQDHIRGGLSFEAKESWFPDPPEGARKAYETRTGPWAERLAHSFAYMPLAPFLSSGEGESLAKQLQTHLQNPNLSPFDKQHSAFIGKMLQSPTEATAVTFLISRPVVIDSETTTKPWLSFNSMLAHPFSRGNSHIASPDPKVRPTIDCAYYSSPLDLEIHAHHIRALQRLARTGPFASFLKPSGARLPPQADGGDEVTLEAAKEGLRAYTGTNYHPCGTCAMLPEGLGGVVDARLRVYGTANVRVVDASVMPVIPRGNIITSVYAVAEKAADLVKEDWRMK